MSTEPAQWVPLSEAAEITGKSTKTMRRWASAGKVGAQKDESGQWFLRRGDLIALEPAAASRAELEVLTDELQSTRRLFHDLANDLATARERAGKAEATAEALQAERDRLAAELEAERSRPWWRRRK